MATDKGKAIVTNSSIQMLMKQSPAAIDRLVEIFYLSEGERNLLLSCNVGEGIFFAGEAHVAMQVIASMKEHQLITTNPAELEAMKRAREQTAAVEAVGGTEEKSSVPLTGSVKTKESFTPLARATEEPPKAVPLPKKSKDEPTILEEGATQKPSADSEEPPKPPLPRGEALRGEPPNPPFPPEADSAEEVPLPTEEPTA